MSVVVWAVLALAGWLRWPWWTPAVAFLVVAAGDVALFYSFGVPLSSVPNIAARTALMLTVYFAAYWAGRTAYRLINGRWRSAS
jgi:hypothetical protein